MVVSLNARLESNKEEEEKMTVFEGSPVRPTGPRAAPSLCLAMFNSLPPGSKRGEVRATVLPSLGCGEVRAILLPSLGYFALCLPGVVRRHEEDQRRHAGCTERRAATNEHSG